MSSTPVAGPSAEPGRWWFGLCAFLLVAFATLQLVWLLYRYVPLHMAFADGMGMTAPLSARIALAAGNWLVRLLPFLVMAAVPLGAILIVLLAILGQRSRVRTATLVHWLSVAGLLLALAEFLAATLIVYSVHQIHEKASTSKQYQQTLADFDEWRRAKKIQTPTPQPEGSAPR